MNKENFADRLIKAADDKKNPSAIGLDPAVEKLPPPLLDKYRLKSAGNSYAAAAEAMLEFNISIIDAVADIAPAVKLQIAYYEELGPDGIEAFRKTSEYAKKNSLIVIGDVKRNDIGPTSRAYSNTYLGKSIIFGEKKALYNIDSITLNAYPGYEGIEPFLNDCREYAKGIFILVKTSNPGSDEFQGQKTPAGFNYEVLGRLTAQWGENMTGLSGYSSVGAVVGATYPQEAAVLRELMKKAVFLVPGYGAQGGDASSIINCFNKDGTGAIINSSRAVIFAYQNKNTAADYASDARESAILMKNEITAALKNHGICRW